MYAVVLFCFVLSKDSACGGLEGSYRSLVMLCGFVIFEVCNALGTLRVIYVTCCGASLFCSIQGQGMRAVGGIMARAVGLWVSAPSSPSG